MSNSKEIVKIGFILFAITAIAALLLSVVNKVTAPVIAENQTEKTFASMRVVMPEAVDFEKQEISGSSTVTEAYSAVNASGEEIGMCVIGTAFGYGGEVKVLTGISCGKVTGIDILSHSETPGLGATATNDDFKNQFIGKENGIVVSKQNAEENEINAISGATITSNAVTGCVNAALEFALKEGK